MADSDAVRQMRRRRHVAGDHSMCRRNCPVPAGSAGITALPAVPGGDSLDPQAAMMALAVRMREAYENDPGNAMLGRELRLTLQALGASAKSGDGDLADLFAALRA